MSTIGFSSRARVAEAGDTDTDFPVAVTVPPFCMQAPPSSAFCCPCRAVERAPLHLGRSSALGASSRVAYESESALIHFVVYLVCFAGCVCVYLNYVVLEAHIFAIFWAVVFSIPLRAVLDALTGRKQKPEVLHQQQQSRRGATAPFSLTSVSSANAELGGGAVSAEELRRAATADSAAFPTRPASPAKNTQTATVNLFANTSDASSSAVTPTLPTGQDSVLLAPSATEGEKRVIRLKWNRRKCSGAVPQDECKVRSSNEASEASVIRSSSPQTALVRSNTAQSIRYRRNKKRKQQSEGSASPDSLNPAPSSKGGSSGSSSLDNKAASQSNSCDERGAQKMPWYYRLPLALGEGVLELGFRFCNSLVAQLIWRLMRLLLLPLAELARAVPDRRASKPWFGLLHRCCLFLILRRLGIPALELQEIVALLLGVSALLLLLQLLMLPLRGSRLMKSIEHWRRRAWVFRPWAFMSDSAVEAYVTPVLAVFVIIVFFLVGCVITAFFCFNIYNEMTTLWDLTQSFVDRHVLQSPLVLKTFKRISAMLWQQQVMAGGSTSALAGDVETSGETSGAAKTIAGLVAAAASAVRGGTVGGGGGMSSAEVTGGSAASSVPMMLLGASLSKYSDLWKAILELASAGAKTAPHSDGSTASRGGSALGESGVDDVMNNWPLTSSNTRLLRSLEKNAERALSSTDAASSSSSSSRQREEGVEATTALMAVSQLPSSSPRRTASAERLQVERPTGETPPSAIDSEGVSVASERMTKSFHVRHHRSDTCIRPLQPAGASNAGFSGTRPEAATEGVKRSVEGGSWLFGVLSSLGWTAPSAAPTDATSDSSSPRYSAQSSGKSQTMHQADTQTCVNPLQDGGWMAFEAAALAAKRNKSSGSSKSIFLRLLSKVFVNEGESERRWAKTQELIGQLTEGDMRGVFTRATEAWRELYSITREAWALKAYEYAQTILAWVFNSGVGAWRVCCFLLALVVRFFLSAFDLLFQAVVFVGALYALLCSRKGTLDFLEEVLCVADPSKILSTSVNEKIRAILFSSVKRLWFYSLFTWLTYEASGLPVVYVPTAASALLAVLPLLPPETISVIPAIVLWWRLDTASESLVKVEATSPSFFDDPLVNLASLTSNPKFASLVIFAANALVWWNVTTCIYREIPDANPWFVGLSAALGMTTLGLKGIIIGPILATIPLIVFTAASKFNERRGVNVDVCAADGQTVRSASGEQLSGFHAASLACLAAAEAEAIKQLAHHEQKLQRQSRRLQELSEHSPREGGWLPQVNASRVNGGNAWTLRRSSSTSGIRGGLSDGGRGDSSSTLVVEDGFSHGLQRKNCRPNVQGFNAHSWVQCRSSRSQRLFSEEQPCIPFTAVGSPVGERRMDMPPHLFTSSPASGMGERKQRESTADMRDASFLTSAPRLWDSRRYPGPSLAPHWKAEARQLDSLADNSTPVEPGLATQVLRGAADALLWFVEKKNGSSPNSALPSTTPHACLTSSSSKMPLERQQQHPPMPLSHTGDKDELELQLRMSLPPAGNSRPARNKYVTPIRSVSAEAFSGQECGKEGAVSFRREIEGRASPLETDICVASLAARGRLLNSSSAEQEARVDGIVHVGSGPKVGSVIAGNGAASRNAKTAS